MSVQLLDKTRKLNKLLHNNSTNVFLFNDICGVLSEILESNVLVLSKKGKILGIGDCFGAYGEGDDWNKVEIGTLIDSDLNERLLSVLSTKENVNLETLGFDREAAGQYHVIISPIDIASERLGTLFCYRPENAYTLDDIILTEYGDAIVGLEMLRSLNEESAEELRARQIVKSAYATLSASEQEAAAHVIREVSSCNGMIIASKLADREGITRSVIVNAIRKLESAGIIDSRSSGMKGTYIKILNDKILEVIEQEE